jgi:hypothetical protein
VRERRRAHPGSVLFLLAAVMFVAAAVLGDWPAFYGVAALFVVVAAAYWFRQRGSC